MGFVAGFTDEPFDVPGVEAEGGAGAGDDVFFHHDAAEIIGAELEGDLADFRTLGDPRALDVFEVVEKDPGDRLHAEVFGCGDGFRTKLGILGLERPADEGGEAAGFILEIAQTTEVLDAVVEGFDMAEHHCGAGAQAELVGLAHHFEPAVGIAFQRSDAVADTVHEDFPATARNRPESGFDELGDDFPDRHAEDFGKVVELRRAEAVDIDLRIFFPDVGEHIQVEIDAEFRVVASLEEDLHATFGRKLVEFFVDLSVGENVMIIVFFGAVECTELAVDVADIGVVDVSIDDIGDHPVAPAIVSSGFGDPTPRIGERAEHFQGHRMQGACVVGRNPTAIQDFVHQFIFGASNRHEKESMPDGVRIQPRVRVSRSGAGCAFLTRRFPAHCGRFSSLLSVSMKFRFLVLAVLLFFTAGVRGETPSIYTGVYDNGSFQSLTFVNSVVGWDTFINAGYSGSGRVIANVEAGLVWDGHEAFARPDGFPATVSLTYAGTGALAEADFHATMVGQVLAGTGYVPGSNPAQFTYAGLGMAPQAEVWSGAIATGYSATAPGSFVTTTESTVSVYRAFFQGIGGVKPDVINSSWGGSDPAAGSPEMLAIDGLARQNSTVAFVASAGNGGNIPVSAPGSTFNGIAVGSLGGATFSTPSSFSSSGAVDFYNPVTQETVTGVRAAVDIAAPGENLVLAAYLGKTGSLGASTDPAIAAMLSDTSPTDRYFLNQSGTSFAAPIVAGGIALLKDEAANDPVFNLNGIAAANDTRVIKSVLMAGATAATGWNNGQAVNAQGVIETTQSLDYVTGAGALNLTNAAEIYLFSGTRDVAGTAGGNISADGWDFANLAPAGSNEYLFSNPFDTQIELTVSLNWFAGRTFNDTTGLGEDLSFANLNLEVWQVLDGVFSTLLAESTSVYNNAEFLRVDLPAGTYGIRITFNGLVYESVGAGTTDESYGLAWRTQSIPEPSVVFLFLAAGAVFALRKGTAVRKMTVAATVFRARNFRRH